MGKRDTVQLPSVALMYAFRYALGRMTYAVGDVADWLIANREVLELDWRAQIVRDITEALEHDRAGMNNDRETWERVRQAFITADPNDPDMRRAQGLEPIRPAKSAVRKAFAQVEANEEASALLDVDKDNRYSQPPTLDDLFGEG